MSFIRSTQEPEWEEDIGTGWYVWANERRICGMPERKKPFIEVVMRMLDQEGSLSDETLQNVHTALRERLGVEGEWDDGILSPEEVSDILARDLGIDPEDFEGDDIEIEPPW